MTEEPKGLAVALERCKEAAHVSGAEIALRTLISSVPYAGSAIIEVLNGLAQRRTQERLNTVFEKMKERLEAVDAEKVDKAFFDTEEFQTLLFLVLEKLHTTHDKKKLEIFGNALANCGGADFKTEDKEMYIRVLRDLSANDLEVLENGMLKNWYPHTHKIVYDTEVLASLSRLAGFGLVYEQLHTKEPSGGSTGVPQLDAMNQLKELLTSPPRRAYHISPFGDRFLRFAAAGQIDEPLEAQDPQGLTSPAVQ